MRPIHLLLALPLVPLFACSADVGTDTCRRLDGVGGGGGARCYTAGDCSLGFDCLGGNCVAVGFAGEACAEGGCDEGLSCVDGVCHGARDRAEGETCDWGSAEPCTDGLYCQPDGRGSTGTCLPLGAFGDACDRRDGCEDGLVCLASGTCGDLPPVGERCALHTLCAEGGTCVRGVCEGPAFAAGDPCVEGGCPDGLYCEDAACAPRLPADEVCDPLDDGDPACASGLFCQRTSRTCQPVRVEGESCDPGDSCEAPFVCQLVDVATGARACGEGSPEGASCADGQACGAGLYCDYRRTVSWPSD